MNSIRQKMSKIIDELVIFQFNAGADEIHMDLRRRPDGFEHCFSSNCQGDMEKYVEHLNRYLNVHRNEAMEAKFWGLSGDDEGRHNAELQLIGQMVDQGEAKVEEGRLMIRVFRRER